jgi:hypothetical protein
MSAGSGRQLLACKTVTRVLKAGVLPPATPAPLSRQAGAGWQSGAHPNRKATFRSGYLKLALTNSPVLAINSSTFSTPWKALNTWSIGLTQSSSGPS